MTALRTEGVLFVHSAPRALTPHIEWAASGILGVPVNLDWRPQPAASGLMRGEINWSGRPGTGAKIASILRGWSQTRYEVTEDPSEQCDGGRWSHTPDLGIYYAPIDKSGNALISEERIKAAMESAGSDAQELRYQLNLALGAAWDAELEVFRYAGDGAPVRWLHRVG